MSAANAPATRTLIDVHIGHRYRVRVGGIERPIEILERVSSSIWLALNIDSGRNLYVVFADLGERIGEEQPAAVNPTKVSEPFRARVLSGRDRASGEREDDEAVIPAVLAKRRAV